MVGGFRHVLVRYVSHTGQPLCAAIQSQLMAETRKSEDALIEWIRARSVARDASILLGIGDDMAMVRTGPEVLLTADMLMDGVDFDSARHAPDEIGRKALAVSLSDCAAMAVRPRWAVVSVALPDAWGMAEARGLHTGIERLAEEFEVRIVGGDTNSWKQPLVIDVTVLAEPWADIAPVTRSGMRPGDAIWVSGPLGGSLSGHHMSFRPRVREARALGAHYGNALHAMLDLSDGLSTDGHRMASASGCGIILEERQLHEAASDAAKEAARGDLEAIVKHVLDDGEDFELLFAVAGDAGEPPAVPNSDGARAARFVRIGVATGEPGLRVRGGDGTLRDVEAGGWQHFTERA